MSRSEVALLEPNTEIMTCPTCGDLIWKHKTDPINVRMTLPSHPWPENGDAFTVMREVADEMHLKNVVLPAEEAAREHFSKRHRIRYWIWNRYGWDRVLRKWCV